MLKKLLTAAQIKEADAYTILHEPISSLDLMERASNRFCDWFISWVQSKDDNIKVFAGIGNNGGDALAIARILTQTGFTISTYGIGDMAKGTDDFKENLLRLENLGVSISHLNDNNDFPVISENDIVVDGLFGSGLSRPLSGIHEKLVKHINNSGAKVIAIDIASGMSCEIDSFKGTAIIPGHTISFQLPKLSFFSPDNEKLVGQLTFIPIDLHPTYFETTSTPYYLLDQDVFQYLPKRRKFLHKGTAGKTLLVAGSKGMIGAAVLAGTACMRSGAGLLTIHIPNVGYNIIQTALPEALCETDEEENLVSKLNYKTLSKYDAIALGPGLGTNTRPKNMLEKTLKEYRRPLILDADALNILSDEAHLIPLIPEDSILTPHPKEFERLAGKTESFGERLKRQVEFSRKCRINIVVKGPYSVITDKEGNIYFNTSGNPGMATAGSGDALTGILLGLLGQQIHPLKSLLLGVYIHGLAGDLAVRDIGEYSLMASDLIQYLSKAFLHDIEK